MAEEEVDDPKLYDSLLDLSIPEQNELTRAFLKKKLNKKPLKSKVMVYENNFEWQVDLKEAPFGISQYRYIFVAVDVSTRLCDAVALPNKTIYYTQLGLQVMLERQIIAPDPPKLIITDAGSEFGPEFTAMCNVYDIKHRRTAPGRKQQTSIVEYINGLIGYALSSHAYRLRTTPANEPPKDMSEIDYFSDEILERTVAAINKFMRTKYPKNAKLWYKYDFDRNPPDLQEGDQVYVPNIQSDRVRIKYGTHKYLRDPFVVTRVFYPVLKNEPYRFMTSYSDKVTFKRDELVKAADYQKNSHVLEFG